jgi:CheY-like chemotaxis protein
MTKRILVVDDDDGIRDIIQFALEAIAGWQVTTVNSGYSAFDKAILIQPDAILLDMMMPDIDGLTVLRHFRDNPITQHIPTILLTAKAKSLDLNRENISDRQDIANLGISGIILKPFKAQTLVEQIRALLNWDSAEC